MDLASESPRGLGALIDALYGQLTRRSGRRSPPLILLTGTGSDASDVVTAYQRRLEPTLARIATVQAVNGKGTDVAGLLGQLTNGLSLRGRGQGWRKRGFPRFETCRTAIAARGCRSDREFGVALYDGLADRHPLIDALANGADGISGTLLILVKFVLQRPVQQFIYKSWLSYAPSLRWVPRLTRSGQDFVTYVKNSADLRNDDWRDRILVEAFLRDLEWQLRSSAYSVGRRRRRPAVLLMSRPPECQAERTFIEKCALILRDRKWGRAPVQIVAVWDPATELTSVDSESVTRIAAGDSVLQDAADALASRHRAAVRREGSPVAMRVPVSFPEASEGPLAYPPSALRKHWHDYLLPATSMAATVVLIAALVWFGWHFPWPGQGACSDTWITSATGERVGITDGNCPLSADPQLLAVEKRIAEQNQQVEDIVDHDPYRRPYQTVVLFSPLTRTSADVGENSLDEARGIQLAQADVIKRVRNDPSEIPVKVLLANSGDRIAEAPQVAPHIVGRAASDRISAVIGISQSRAEAHQAIQILSDGLKVPIIGSVTTGDRMLDSSPRYYEIVPRNSREAQTIAQFLDHQPVMVGPHGEQVLTGNAVVVEDPRDEYSQNIAEDFRRSFTASGHRTVTFDYGPPEDGPPARDSKNIGDTPESSASELVHDMCRTIGSEPDIVFYASRAQELPGVLDKLDSEPECRGRQLGIMGTDEVTRFISDGTLRPSAYPAAHFYNASFSDLTDPPTSVATSFISEYKAVYGSIPGDSGAADVDDAFISAWAAINQAYQQDKTIPPGTVTAEMADGQVKFTGVTGLITFSGAHDITRVPSDKPVFIMFEPQSGGPVPLLSCGQYAEGSAWVTWGAGHFRCPHDPSS